MRPETKSRRTRFRRVSVKSFDVSPEWEGRVRCCARRVGDMSLTKQEFEVEAQMAAQWQDPLLKLLCRDRRAAPW